jgi:hypothetical protein
MALGEAKSNGRRVVVGVVSTILLVAACCAVAFSFGGNDTSSELLSSATSQHAKLAFGDASFQPPKTSAAVREGSVRDGKKPDFSPPIGSLGSTGLKNAEQVKIEKLSLKRINPNNPMLAFGDADGFKASHNPAV